MPFKRSLKLVRIRSWKKSSRSMLLDSTETINLTSKKLSTSMSTTSHHTQAPHSQASISASQHYTAPLLPTLQQQPPPLVDGEATPQPQNGTQVAQPPQLLLEHNQPQLPLIQHLSSLKISCMNQSLSAQLSDKSLMLMVIS